MTAPSTMHDELTSTGSTAPPTAPEYHVVGTIRPEMLHIIAPQSTQPIAFGGGGLVEHAFVPPAVQHMPKDSSDPVVSRADIKFPSSAGTMVISWPAIVDSQPHRSQGSTKSPPRPPRPSKSESRVGTAPPAQSRRPMWTRVEKSRRTAQACEGCRDRKLKCDGARPCCARCRQLGDSCRYVLDHKAVRAQLRKLQKEGLLPESILLSSVSQPWARAPKKTSSLPQRPTGPSLSNGSSASSSASCTPLATPTEEGPFQLGVMSAGLAVLFGTSDASQKRAVHQQPTLSPNYPPSIMAYPGRSFPLMTTRGEYFEELRLVPELCDRAHNLVAIPANAYILPHGAVNASTMNAKAIWMDTAVPSLRQDPGTTVRGVENAFFTLSV